MTILLAALDLCLAATLLGLAWAMLFSRDDFRAVVLFISLGLVMALVWVRLSAPEVALAEAAIGAGISGALLLTALPRLPQTEPGDDSAAAGNHHSLPIIFLAVGALLFFLTLGVGLLTIPGFRIGPAPLTTELMPLSGVNNRVTAVLLNFRGFDTMLELAVLLLAVVGIWSLARTDPGEGSATLPAPPAGPVLMTLARGIFPLAILIAGYLVWIGDRAPGGAFQGGAVLGAAGVLLALTGRPLPGLCPQPLLRAILVFGLLIFLLLSALPLAGGRLFFQYPADLAGLFILAIEAAAALSIGLALSLLAEGQPQ